MTDGKGALCSPEVPGTENAHLKHFVTKMEVAALDCKLVLSVYFGVYSETFDNSGLHRRLRTGTE